MNETFTRSIRSKDPKDLLLNAIQLNGSIDHWKWVFYSVRKRFNIKNDYFFQIWRTESFDLLVREGHIPSFINPTKVSVSRTVNDPWNNFTAGYIRIFISAKGTLTYIMEPSVSIVHMHKDT